MENIAFEAKITEADLYRFNIHHAYTSSQGVFSIIVSGLIVVAWIMQFQRLSSLYLVLYPLMALLFLLYIPMNLKLRAKNQMQQDVFSCPLTYTFHGDGVRISSPVADEPAELPWDYVYKIVTWKEYLLIYSNRVNAYIIPKAQIAAEYDAVIDYIKNHVEDYKLSIK